MKDAKSYEGDGEFNDSYQPMGESFKDSDDSDDDDEEDHVRPPPRQSRPAPREARQAPRQTPPPSNGKFKFNDDEESIAPRRRRPEPKKETPAPPVVKETPKEAPSLVGDLWDAPVPASPAKKTPTSSASNGASLIGSTSSSSAASANRPHVAISSMAMEMVTDGRDKGAEAVKQGSYDIALEHYNVALLNLSLIHI